MLWFAISGGLALAGLIARARGQTEPPWRRPALCAWSAAGLLFVLYLVYAEICAPPSHLCASGLQSVHLLTLAVLLDRLPPLAGAARRRTRQGNTHDRRIATAIAGRYVTLRIIARTATEPPHHPPGARAGMVAGRRLRGSHAAQDTSRGDMDTMSIAPFYKGWDNYQRLLVEAIAPLTDAQIAFRGSRAQPAAGLGAGGAHHLGAHSWLHRRLDEGPAELLAYLPWDDDGEPQRGAAALVSGLEATWAVIADCLNRWTPAAIWRASSGPSSTAR